MRINSSIEVGIYYDYRWLVSDSLSLGYRWLSMVIDGFRRSPTVIDGYRRLIYLAAYCRRLLQMTEMIIANAQTIWNIFEPVITLDNHR